MRILIVDDSRAMRMIIARTLRQAGYKDHVVEEAGDGAAALEAIRASVPDVVMSDWNMPVMNGIELLEELQKNGPNQTFGFLTTEGSDEMRERAKTAGAKFFSPKPYSPQPCQHALRRIQRLQPVGVGFDNRRCSFSRQANGRRWGDFFGRRSRIVRAMG